MSGSIQGANQGALQANQNVGNKAALNELKEYISQTANETMNALKDLTEELSGKVKVKDPNKSQKKEALNEKTTIKQGNVEAGEEVAAASISAQDELKKNKKDFEEKAKTRIKTGLILNEFGEKNQIKVTEQEVQAEVQKQLRMMPGQEKMVMDFYQKNPSALASLRGTVYEEKILNLIKEKGKANKTEISKEEAEKIFTHSSSPVSQQ